MANVIPNRDVVRQAPAAIDAPSTVPAHRSDEASDLSPWPVADTPGRPYIHPHRLAQATRDRDAAYNRLRPNHRWSELAEEMRRAERINDRLYTWAITISVTMMGVAILMTLCTQFIDGKLGQ